ncbi:piggyBac transposable element-derived protein 4-like [Bombus pyrosoma]|uniref:piggyBac transposable element-derived protein 4-like n=1 Tax=Bombus pyrosoma TaxID=396416 RepID=UPI001CB8DF6B|nr:piggyBac transposable element-derived protein 4-like [Bombus pyrosoma]
MVRRYTKNCIISDSEDSSNDNVQCSDNDTPLSERLNKFMGKRQWKVPTATENFKPRVINYIDDNIGVQQASGLSKNSCPTSIFEYFFNQELVEMIVNNSNKHRSEQDFSRFYDITVTDMYSAIAVIIYMSIVHLPSISMYWNSDPMYNFQFIRKIMSRHKFLRILQFLHFSDEDNDEIDEKDATYKIQPVIDRLLLRFQGAYRPGRNIVVDESMMLWKHSLPFDQYNKRATFGLKSFVLAECETGYVYNLKLYSGQLLRELNSGPLGASGSIVLHLTKHLLQQGRTLFLNNYHSSPALYEILHKNGTNVCGIVRLKRKGMPRYGMIARDINRLEKGQMLVKYNETVAFCAWKDKKLVSTLTTVHDPCLVMSTNIDRVTGQYRKKLNVFLDYNMYMTGANQMREIVQRHFTISKSLKWHKKYFLHLLDITIFNCLVIWNSCHEDKKSFREIKEDIISGLLEKYLTPSKSFHREIRKSWRKFPFYIKFRCYPKRIPSTQKRYHPLKRCVLCKENNLGKQMSYLCNNCNVPLCIIPCFGLFHTRME